MRILLYILALTIIPMLSMANHIEKDLEGYWDDIRTHASIKVKAKRYGFKIKGINGRNRWTRFKRNYRGQLLDSRGNRLVIRHRNQMELVNRRHRLITTFVRPGASYGDDYGIYPYNRDYYREYNHYYSQGYQDGYQDNGYYRQDDRQGGYYRGDDQRNRRDRRAGRAQENTLSYTPIRIDQDRLKSMEGTWRSEGRNGKKVVIVSTRDGIKVKDTTNNKWHRYRLSSDKKSLVDERGNLYQMDKRSLFWSAKDRKRILRLEKRSSTTF